MKTYDAYLYGMILITNSFLLKDEYPQADTYGEIKEKYVLPGGETGTCGTVLSALGCKVIFEGTNTGKKTYPLLCDFYKNTNVDTSLLYPDLSYDGLEDYVMIDQNTRTPFGTFGSYYSDTIKRWHEPNEEKILSSKVAGIDPWFGEQSIRVARICKENNIPFATIDCEYDSELNKLASVNVLSNEFLGPKYKDTDRKELFKKYQENTDGLVIFTLGAKEIMYGRKGEEIKYFKPYNVPVVSTLGAGDTFKAGCVYALLQNMKDDDIVSFASAAAGCACTAFPLPLNPPTLEKIQKIRNQR